MNLSIYLDDERAKRLSRVARTKKQSRDAIIRDAIDLWLSRDADTGTWPESVRDFESNAQLPAFESYRETVREHNTDPLA